MNRFSQSLSFKIGSLIILAEVLILSIVATLYAIRFSEQIDLRSEERVQLLGRLINSSLVRIVSLRNADTIRLLVGEDVIDVALVDANAQIVYSLGGDYNIPIERLALSPEWFNFDQPISTLQRINSADSQALISVSPILDPGRTTVTYFLYVKISTAAAEAEKQNLLLLLMLGSVGTLGFTSLILLVSFRQAIFTRLQKTLVVLKRLEEGDLSARIDPVHTLDEIGVLQAGVNAMAQKREHSERDIRSLNAALQQLNLHLEQRVLERTHELELARREAETARQAAEQSNQVKSQFLANMSHELRTPLNSILNFTAFVADGLMGPVNDEQVDALQQSIHSGKHLLALINDVLDITKIEAGLMDMFIQEVDLNEAIAVVVSMAKGLVKDKTINLELEVAEHLPATFGDKRRLRQVMLNIISNAVKFTRQGKVIIRAYATGEQIRFEVQDTGIGIAPADQYLVFESFKQAKHDLLETPGTGLGMPISKFFVEAHGGRIWFESTLDVGSTFYVELPILTETQANQLAAQPRSLSTVA
jgi:signal transduction histidine kinase